MRGQEGSECRVDRSSFGDRSPVADGLSTTLGQSRPTGLMRSRRRKRLVADCPWCRRLIRPWLYCLSGLSRTSLHRPFLRDVRVQLRLLPRRLQLLPTAPYRILELGGSEVTAGMFLGFLTYASAASAPITGSLADRFGRRRMLIACSLALSALRGRLRGDPRLPGAARSRRRPRLLPVGPAVCVLRVHDRLHASGPPRGGDRVLGPLDDVGPRLCAVAGVLAVPHAGDGCGSALRWAFSILWRPPSPSSSSR